MPIVFNHSNQSGNKKCRLIETMAMNEGSYASLSEKSGDEEEFIRIAIEVSKLAGDFCLADMYPSNEMLKLITELRLKLEKLHKASDRIPERIINQHKDAMKEMTETQTGNEKAKEDLVDFLLNLQQQTDYDFPLSNDSNKAVIQIRVINFILIHAITVPCTLERLQKNSSNVIIAILTNKTTEKNNYKYIK